MVQGKVFIAGATQIGYVVLAKNKDVPPTEKLHFEQPNGLEFVICFVYHFTTANQEHQGVVDGEEETRRPEGRDIA